MGDIGEQVQEVVEEAGGSRLNSMIALLVAITATFMAVCNIKDGNIVQNMSVIQSNIVDTWSQYQAKSTKQHMSASMLDEFTVQRAVLAGPTEEAQKTLDDRIAFYKSEVDRYDKDKTELKKKADELQTAYDDLNIHDDQFDMSEALVSVGIALAGVTALTKKKWLLGFACVFSAIGLFLGMCGFVGYAFHPEWLAKLLT